MEKRKRKKRWPWEEEDEKKQRRGAKVLWRRRKSAFRPGTEAAQCGMC